MPSDSEWTTLTTFLGGESIAGGAMKSTSTLWQSPNTGATNSSGFTGLPGGYYNSTFFGALGRQGLWWSSTYGVHNPLSVYSRYLGTDGPGVVRKDDYIKGNWGSVRCIRN